MRVCLWHACTPLHLLPGFSTHDVLLALHLRLSHHTRTCWVLSHRKDLQSNHMTLPDHGQRVLAVCKDCRLEPRPEARNCRIGLEFTRGHRLYDMQTYLHLASRAADESGLCLTDLYVNLDHQPGSFTSPLSQNSAPLSLFADKYSSAKCLCPPHGASVQRVLLRAYDTKCNSCGKQQTPRWCDGALCVSLCAPCGNNATSVRGGYQSIAVIIHDAILFLDATLEKNTYTIVVELGTGHSHTILGAPLMRQGAIQYMPSPYMLRVADFVLRSYLSCNGETNGTFAAMLRIAYGGGRFGHGSVLQYARQCQAALDNVHQYFGRRARCGNAGYLATDVFAQADGWINRSYANAFESCWNQGMQISKSKTGWFFVENHRMLSFLTSATTFPCCNEGKAQIGRSEWFRAFLDLAVLMSVSTCYVQGHMGTLVGGMRRTTGKKPCNTR